MTLPLQRDIAEVYKEIENLRKETQQGIESLVRRRMLNWQN